MSWKDCKNSLIMLSNASKYTVNAVLYLATTSSEDKKASIKEVSEAISAPSPFLAKQLQILARNEIISSSKGPGGGFYLTEGNKQIKIIRIVDCIDGLTRFNTCVLGLKACNHRKPCPIHSVIDPFRIELLNNLTKNTVESLANDVIKGRTFLIE